MRQERNELKIGITVAVVILLFLAVLGFVGNWDRMFTETQTITVRFEETGGLRVGDPVSVRGVNVGQVTAIQHRQDSQTGKLAVLVQAQIPEHFTIHRDAAIGIGTAVLGEGGSLKITDTGDEGPRIDADVVIEGQPPAGMNQLLEKIARELDETQPDSLLAQLKGQLNPDNPQSIIAKIHHSLDDVNAISTSLRREMNPEEQAALMAKVHVTVDRINALTDVLRGELDRGDKEAALGRVYAALDKLNESLAATQAMIEENRPKIDRTLNHVETTAKRLDEEISAPLAEETNRENPNSLLAKLHESMSLAQTSLQNVREISDTGQQFVSLNRDALQSTVDDFAETAAHLKATAKEIRQNPWRLLHKPEQEEVEYANLMAAARSFADAAGTLDRVNNKLTQLIKIAGETLEATDPQLQQIREQVNQAYCEFEEAQKKLWDLLKSRS